jgi:hypothetical protein
MGNAGSSTHSIPNTMEYIMTTAKLNDTSILSSWIYTPITIRDFLLEAGDIDCNPIWQRPDISSIAASENSRPSKQQSIIQSILDGIDIGEIKLCYYHGRKSSIDGGNRKRAIISFMNNGFKLHKSSSYGNVYYHQLPEKVKKQMMDYRLRVIQYGELSDEIIGLMFRSTNNTTHVNHQEYLNSHGMNPIARLVRETVRKFSDIQDSHKKHDLFECKAKSNGDIEYKYFSFNNKRLFLEEIVARILCRIVHGETFGIVSDEMLEKMYVEQGKACENDPKLLETYKKKLTAALNFFMEVLEVAKVYRGGKGVAIRQFSMLFRLYFHFKGKYGDFRVSSYEKFWENFFDAFIKFDAKSSTRKETFQERGTGKTRVVSEAFNGYLSFELDDVWKVNKSLAWMLEEFDPLEVITPVDPKRCFTREEIEQALTQQKFLCYVDGRPLTMKDAAGAHKKAWSKGGKTVRNNLVAVRTIHNKQSGSMDIDTYKSAMKF